MSNEKFEEGRRKAMELSVEQRVNAAVKTAEDQHAIKIATLNKGWMRTLWVVIATLLIFQAFMYGMLMSTIEREQSLPRLEWTSVTAMPPAPWVPLVVAKRDGTWDAGFLNEEGEFQRYCDGTRIRGAWYYINIPQHP